MTGRLGPESIYQLIQAAVQLEFYNRRQILLLGISWKFQSTMPMARGERMRDQLVLDLNYLNEVGILSDGSDPLKTWLNNAIEAAGGVQEEAVFRSALAELDRPTRDPHDVPPKARLSTHSSSLIRQMGAVWPISGPIRQEASLIPVVMRRMDETILNFTIKRWLKRQGDQVRVDEPLLEISLDKVDIEIPSPATGYLYRIYVPENKTVEIGVTLAVIEKRL
jgi:biotin carboxyl carrier protein